MRRLTREQIIGRLVEKHPEYDYSLLSAEVTTKDKLRVMCSSHGEFNPTYHDHLYHGSKCPACSREAKTKSTKDFIQQAEIVHTNRYDYSFVRYLNNKTKVTIVCPEHGPFEQTPYSHVSYGNGCPKCGVDVQRKSRDDFITEALQLHNHKYDYTQVTYQNTHTHVTIICPEHGPFEQTPTNHLNRRSGCPLCATHVKYTERYFNTYPEMGDVPGLLYVVRMMCGSERFLKVGITKHGTVERRYEQSPEISYDIETVNTRTMRLKDAFTLEQIIFATLSDLAYYPLKKFSGWTECLKDTEEVIEYLNKILDKENNSWRC